MGSMDVERLESVAGVAVAVVTVQGCTAASEGVLAVRAVESATAAAVGVLGARVVAVWAAVVAAWEAMALVVVAEAGAWVEPEALEVMVTAIMEVASGAVACEVARRAVELVGPDLGGEREAGVQEEASLAEAEGELDSKEVWMGVARWEAIVVMVMVAGLLVRAVAQAVAIAEAARRQVRWIGRTSNPNRLCSTASRFLRRNTALAATRA